MLKQEMLIFIQVKDMTRDIVSQFFQPSVSVVTNQEKQTSYFLLL